MGEGRNIRVVGQLGDFAHLSPRWAPWVVTRRCEATSAVRFQSQRTTSLRDLARQTFADLDLDAGIALGHILDASHYLRHLGGCVRGRWELSDVEERRCGGFGLAARRGDRATMCVRLSLREMVIFLQDEKEAALRSMHPASGLSVPLLQCVRAMECSSG